ncbi:MAG: carboxypeptidase-like regulatory domain-containing protein, partial [Ferruginibacter sp.]
MKSNKTTCLQRLQLWGILTLFLLSFNYSYAQSVKISGTVTNQRTSAPAAGATITVKNTNRITVSDNTGKFTIDASPGEVLVITTVGYVKKELVVGNSSINIKVKLVETISQLDDVVVIGYGKAKRKDATGSISSVSGADLRKTQPTTFDQALQGKVAGVMVQQVSGQPGGGVSIQIHGISSVSGSNSPLYVID